MDHGKLRGAQRFSAEPDPIDLGHEPPLSVDGETSGLVDRRRVSVHWLSGTILTGFCGAALMGGAVFASLDGETNFATVPERVETALRGAVGTISDRLGVRKSDKLPAVLEPNVVRQIIRVSTTTQVGNREVVRVRPFVRVAGNLSLTLTEVSADVPPFNPQKMLAEFGAPATPTAESAAAEPDAEVSFVTRDLASILPRAKINVAAPMDEVLQRVREAANWTGGPTRTASAGPAEIGAVPFKLAYATEGNIADPYAGFEARIVPENITFLPKTAKQTTGGNNWNERAITAKKGDTLNTVLQEVGATPEEIKAIAKALGARGSALKEGVKLRVLLAATAGGSRLQPIRVIIGNDNAIESIVALSDIGKYVAVDARNLGSTEVAEVADEEEDATGVRLYQSLYETALRNQLPRPVIEDLIRLYSYDVDFQRKVQPGDSFEVLFAGEEETHGAEGRADVMFASLTISGEVKKYYRFQTPDDGVVDYYDEAGKSAKKFLVRKPVGTGIMRSGFGFRRHPILGATKMHTGVDWSAPTGTPIYASGNGTVDKVGWESGYGKYIRIRHTNGYETAYGHMTAFARGIDPGVRVRQGQVIGFVGSTGLSTGAHVHYEIMVNGRFVDPMRIRLPRGRVLEGPVLADFDQERERLDTMMTRPAARLASSGQSDRR
ncbi:MAG TPA: M23 family metallopeptidase [Xanthobacteraceae bacterium]|nr:M23 family metallopeptidase [Xanthobacteraceae bacterium]